MHNHRREHFFQDQRRARAHDRTLDRYVADRVAVRAGKRAAAAAEVHTLPVPDKPSHELRYARTSS
jgi:hypothetical protein